MRSVVGMAGLPICRHRLVQQPGLYEGFSLLTAVEPSGVITGFCFGAASTADQPLAETFFNLRANPNPRLISVGSAFSGTYVADKLRRR